MNTSIMEKDLRLAFNNLNITTKESFIDICKKDKCGGLDPFGFFTRIIRSHFNGNCSVVTLSETYNLTIEMINEIIESYNKVKNGTDRD